MDFKNLDLNLLKNALNQFIGEYQVLLNVGAAFGVLTGILAFIFLLLQLSANGEVPQERTRILKELFVVGISTSLLGSFTFAMSLYYSIMFG